MLNIIDTTGPVAAFEASATLSGDDYARLTAELERRLSEHERIAIFADVRALDGLSLDALLHDLRYSTSKLGELDRFARVAVVSDRMWMRAWTRLAWSLVPKADVKSFSGQERDAALAWASELQPEPLQRGLQWIDTDRPDTVAFAWTGTITDQDIETVIARLERALEAQPHLRVLARVERLGGIRPHALFQSALARTKWLGLHKVERYALVGGPAWFARYAPMLERVTGVKMRHFSREEEAEAWSWLEAHPAPTSAATGPAAHP